VIVLDVNECQVDNGGCSQSCENEPGTFSCECSPGFQLNADQRTCTGGWQIVYLHSDVAKSDYEGPDPVKS
jgi:hypothetical protein